MTEEGTGATSEDCPQRLAVMGKVYVADCVHAAVQPVEVALSSGSRNFVARIAQWPSQLTYRDDSVLPIREFRQRVMPPRP